MEAFTFGLHKTQKRASEPHSLHLEDVKDANIKHKLPNMTNVGSFKLNNAAKRVPSFISIKNKAVEGNILLAQLLQRDETFSVARCGIGAETVFSYCYLYGIKDYEEKYPNITSQLHNNCGIYFNEEKYDGKDEELYATLFNMALKTCTYIACWNNSWISEFETQFIHTFQISNFDAAGLDFFAFSTPWTKYLAGKKVLVIHPFAESIQSQYKKRNLLFQNKDTLPEFELLTLKSMNTSAGNKIGDSWVDNYNEMCDKISKMDFDIALLGCGGYGLPLLNYIYNHKKRSAIYLGGILQLLFGIKGKRWDERPNVAALYNEHWIRPSEKEHVRGYLKIEDGCYW
jgi:hypothetical protein